jgi:ComF family protein
MGAESPVGVESIGGASTDRAAPLILCGESFSLRWNAMPAGGLLTVALRALLPERCAFCGARAQAGEVCGDCLQDLPGRRGERCRVCAIPVAGALVCGQCLRDPPSYSHTVAAADYRFPLDAAIARLKYGPDLSLLVALAHLLARAVRGQPPPDALVPMPLSAAGLRARGFNQATELGRLIAREVGAPLALGVATRCKDTAPQASLPFDRRAGNVRDAFACDASVAGLRVTLLDDVMTTGATVEELARTLRRAGAAEVGVWVLARTPRPD